MLLCHRIIVASMYVAIAIVGIPGNTLVIASTILQKKLQTTTNVLVVNLALADLITCLCIPLHIPRLINPSGEYPLPDAVCGAVAGIMYSSIVCGIETMAAIGFVRWYVITRSLRGQHGINSPCGLAIVVGVCWVAAFLVICLPPIHGVGHLGYSHVLATCSSNPGPIKLLMSWLSLAHRPCLQYDPHLRVAAHQAVSSPIRRKILPIHEQRVDQPAAVSHHLKPTRHRNHEEPLHRRVHLRSR